MNTAIKEKINQVKYVKNNPKIKKLINKPDLFFHDLINKRLGKSASPTNPSNTTYSNIKPEYNYPRLEYSSIYKHRQINYKFDTHALCLEIVKTLTLNTQLVLCHRYNPAGEFKIICNTDQLANVHQIIRSFQHDKLKIFSSQNQALRLQKTPIEYAFYDQDTVYLNRKIIVEPWFKNQTHIFTYNPNQLLTHLDKRFLNKSVYSSHPITLQGKYSTPYVEDILGLNTHSFNHYHFPVDVVLTWVNGKDPAWLSKKQKYQQSHQGNTEDDSSSRYDQIDEIKYCLRSIEKNLKFIRHIFLVTDHQFPWWLDIETDKITVIPHTEIIDQAYLPTFNSHVIESYLHQIPDLSEHFLYLNDDCFIWQPLEIDDFFTPGGISLSRFEHFKNVYGLRSDPCNPGWKNAAINANQILKKLNLAKGVSYHLHTPFALKKSVLHNLEITCSNVYDDFRINKTRGTNDISTVSFLYHHYAIQKGEAVHLKESQHISITINSANQHSLDQFKANKMNNSDLKFVCINDGGTSKHTNTVLSILQTQFPEKADWEL